MDGEIVKKVIVNLRNPVNAKARVQFTSRSILFLTRLFEGKRTDTIELHCILLQMAHISGCFRDTSSKYINLRDLIVYLCSRIPTCVSMQDIRTVADIFTTNLDSDYKEVEDMKIIIDSIEY